MNINMDAIAYDFLRLMKDDNDANYDDRVWLANRIISRLNGAVSDATLEDAAEMRRMVAALESQMESFAEKDKMGAHRFAKRLIAIAISEGRVNPIKTAMMYAKKQGLKDDLEMLAKMLVVAEKKERLERDEWLKKPSGGTGWMDYDA